MFRFLETIRCENGKFNNLGYHQQRVNDTRQCFYPGSEIIDLSLLTVPSRNQSGLFKCRIVYGQSIETLEFLPYEIPVIRSLQLLADEEVDYRFKYADRSRLTALLDNKGLADEVLIIKKGLITDTSMANILFFNGRKWLTPAHPLLKGTQRSKLIEEEKIIEADIRPSDLKHFIHARLINAMMRFEDKVDVEICKVFY